ncbi:MAG TPA: helix-turn-helix domain-containing protein [Polyangiaceae bacterium]|nr:helix-turn-helix domain-containing protein [Polyangiaceae bacterium]
MRLVSIIALDDRAKTESFGVDSALAQHVYGYWRLSVVDPPARLRVVPDGHVDLVFDPELREAYVAGPRDTPLEVEHARATDLLGATLSPGSAMALLSIEGRALSPDWTPLDAVLGELGRALAERVADAPSTLLRVSVIETFLLARLAPKDLRLERALSVIDSSEGRVAVAELGRESGASPRNLSRLFHAWVGLSPKRFARIARAQAALRRLSEIETGDLGALAAELGFADQAHLTRELKAIAGAAPSHLAETFKRKSDSFKR